MQLAFIGTIVPDTPAFRSVAFSRAGNMFQTNLLSGLKNAGLSPSVILSQRPAPAFPRSKKLLYFPQKSRLENGQPIYLLPFINIPILRPITIGLAVLLNLLWWGWQHRDVHDKVVMTFNLTEPPGLFTLIGARLISAKVVAHIADINVPGETVDATIQRWIDYWLQSKLISRFDGLTVVSDSMAYDFAPKLPYLRVECGVSDEMVSYVIRHANIRKRAGDRFIIVSAGSLNEANGFVELLEAFSLLKGDKYRLRIAGMGPLESTIRQAASTDPRIEFCGYLPFEEVMSLYMAADVLVNMRITQRINTKYFFPSKTMEYLITGVPVIMTHIGDAVKDFAQIAFLLRDENPQALAQMIEDVAALDPVIREAKGKSAQEYIKTHHTWALHGQRVLNFLNTLIEH